MDDISLGIKSALNKEEDGMNIPDKIYLQIKDEDGDPTDEVTWCVDQIYDTDVEYARLTRETFHQSIADILLDYALRTPEREEILRRILEECKTEEVS